MNKKNNDYMDNVHFFLAMEFGAAGLISEILAFIVLLQNRGSVAIPVFVIVGGILLFVTIVQFVMGLAKSI